MKILVIQQYGIHKENSHFRECLSFQKAFKSFGHDTDCWGLGHPNYDQKINFNSYDLILNCENYGDEWLPDFNEIKKPYKILYSIDPHVRGIYPYEKIFREKSYNFMFVAIRDFCNSPDRAWLPPAIDEEFFLKKNISKDIFLGFVGNILNRKSILDYMINNHGLQQYVMLIGEKMVDHINRFKIHFNKNISIGSNYRNFETVGCGTVLLTSGCNEYSDLGFFDGKNCLIYNNLTELEEKINFCKKNPEKLIEIEMNALELAKKHTYKKRVESILKFLKTKI